MQLAQDVVSASGVNGDLVSVSVVEWSPQQVGLTSVTSQSHRSFFLGMGTLKISSLSNFQLRRSVLLAVRRLAAPLHPLPPTCGDPVVSGSLWSFTALDFCPLASHFRSFKARPHVLFLCLSNFIFTFKSLVQWG